MRENTPSPELNLLPTTTAISPTLDQPASDPNPAHTIGNNRETNEEPDSPVKEKSTVAPSLKQDEGKDQDVLTSHPGEGNNQPSVPPRPCLPPRPFLPRVSPSHKNRSSDLPTKPQRTREYPNAARDPKKRTPSHTKGLNKRTVKKDAICDDSADTLISHDTVPKSHDASNKKSNQKYDHAIMMSVEEPFPSLLLDAPADSKEREESSITITDQGVEFGFPSNIEFKAPPDIPPNYFTSPATLTVTAMDENADDEAGSVSSSNHSPKTLFDINEGQEQVSCVSYVYY